MQRSRNRRLSSILSLVDTIGISEEKGVVYGVILDATGHYKTNDSIDYVTRLRIIDHTLNVSHRQLSRAIKPYIYVFIYSESVALAPQIGRVGDVIRLQNFVFSEFESKPKAVFHRKRSSWDIFDGRKNANDLPVMSSHKERAGLAENEKKYLQTLRLWAEDFFSRRSLYTMDWFKRNMPSGKKGKIWEMQDVDIIAKLLADVSIKKDKQFYQRLVFVDKDKNIFLAELKGLLTGIDKGDVLKLRSIGIVCSDQQHKITFSSYSNFMVLQKNFKDAKELIRLTRKVTYNQDHLRKEFLKELHLSKRSKEMIGPNTFIYRTNKHQIDPQHSQKNLEIIFPILKNFSYDVTSMGELTGARPSSRKKRARTSSAVLHKHSALEFSSLKSVLKLLSQIERKKDKDRKKILSKPQYFKVKVQIENVENLEFESNFKIFSPSTNKTWSINRSHIKGIPPDCKVIFYNVFGLRDKSLEDSEGSVHSYLITYNENPKYIYDLWRLLPDPLVVKDWLALDQERKEKFSDCLERLIDTKKKFDLILQVVEAEGGRVYLKIVDSIFWIARQGYR